LKRLAAGIFASLPATLMPRIRREFSLEILAIPKIFLEIFGDIALRFGSTSNGDRAGGGAPLSLRAL
jgi:hypothetical protein